jgi:hypothetical protein
MKKARTSKDVKLEEWEILAESAINALGAGRLMLWLRGPEEDNSCAEAFENLAKALGNIGLTQISLRNGRYSRASDSALAKLESSES